MTTDPISTLRASRQIAEMRRRLLDDPNPMTYAQKVQMARWLKDLLECHWRELGDAQLRGLKMRPGSNVINLEHINRRFDGVGDAPSDTQPRGAA